MQRHSDRPPRELCPVIVPKVLRRVLNAIRVTSARAVLQTVVVVSRPSQPAKSAFESSDADRSLGVAGLDASQKSNDAGRVIALLRTPHHRPRRRRPKPPDKLPPSHPSTLALIGEAESQRRFRGNRGFYRRLLSVALLHCVRPDYVQVFGRRNAKPIRALGRPASEKRQGTKSRWVGHWRCRGLYGELSGASGSKRTRRSGPTHGFDPRRGCRCGAERADRRFVDRNGAGGAGRSDGPTQAGAMPVEIRREWLVSLRFRIGNDGIMRCRS